ncbi:hypothetical protein EK21DRAFT_76339 [Setomelanomma holmii]|uniref:DUF1279 domain-containing protein n=1 Tax=Setomelanomma holmii TaxID=210430 RepID=A0A9P4H0N8_9PLEO|nr:hypothetical protein EK21DRAFT_76339 [Setomelanomma holmii]
MKTRIARIWTEQLLSRGSAQASAGRPTTFLVRTFFAASRPAAGPGLAQSSLEHGSLILARCQRSALARRMRSLRFKSDKTPSPQINPTPHLGSPEPALSLSQRLKKLSREYGWTAVGVYFALSVLDFPFCFLAVRLLGTDRIGHYEDVVKNAFWTVVRAAFPEAGKRSAEAAATEDVAEATAREGDLSAAEVAIRSGADASIWTQLGLAYIVHKSFIFIRVPLTAAVLPKVVKTLRKWGYDIGKKKPKTA